MASVITGGELFVCRRIKPLGKVITMSTSSKRADVHVAPIKEDWGKAWAVTKRDFRENLIGFFSVVIFFAVLVGAVVVWQVGGLGGNDNSCYSGAPGASGLPVNQVECR